jgi:C4-dicarboxylate-specific signal transduction histidine kinase
MDAFGPEAAYIARMTASTTHELRNALAVVKESAGLVDDLTQALQRRKSIDPDKMLSATRRIDAQVARAADLLTSLNRLAHGLDHARERLDLGQHIRHVVFLCQRFARLRRSRLELGPDGDGHAVRANALHLLMLLTAAIDCCLERLPEESVIGVRVSGTAAGPAIELTGSTDGVAPSASPDDTAAWPRLTGLAERLGVTVAARAPGFGIRLQFPPDTG